MKALISGRNGFLGTHLANKLQGWEVIPIPRNLLGQTELKEFVEWENPDYIFHLASYGNMSNQKEEDEIVKANVFNTWNLLLASKNVRYKAFINFGSSSEYGHKKSPMLERDIPETDSFYGASKVAGTYLARAFATQFNKPIVTVRPFSVYGEGEADFRFIPTVIRSLVTPTSMSLDEKMPHDWIHVDDFIDGVMVVTAHAEDLKGQVVNIGTGRQFTNQEVVEELEKIHGEKLMVDVLGYPRMSTTTLWVADNTLLRSLGWEQKVSLSEGLKRCYEYYKQRLKV